MAKTKRVLRAVAIEVAQRKRKCYHTGSHSIPKGTKCLVETDAGGTKRNYCPKCATAILDAAEGDLARLRLELA
jgi:hypothetical protein